MSGLFSPVRESAVEAYFRDLVNGSGNAKAIKLVSPSFAGLPDRLVLIRAMDAAPARVAFVELKRPGGRLSAMQTRVFDWLEGWGFDVEVVSSKPEAEAWAKARGLQK